jgi:hypothetical protein
MPLLATKKELESDLNKVNREIRDHDVAAQPLLDKHKIAVARKNLR